jgi:TrmH family RNA methyltransferase
MSKDCADIYSSKTVRASMGTLFSTRVDRVADIPCVIRNLTDSGRRVFAAALNREAQRLGEFAVQSGDCVVIGNEGHGLSDAICKACGNSVIIPMSERAESFNAAVAASILMWEFAKRK